MTKKKKIIILLTSIIILIIFSPYLKAEYLTYRYGELFQDGYLQTHMIDNIEYFKVLGKSDTKAKVLYIAEEHSSSSIILFDKVNKIWVMSDWIVVWSKSGSADDFIWPYYP